MRRQIIAEQLEAVLRNSLQAPGLRLLSLDGERPSVDAKREPWIEIKYIGLESCPQRRSSNGPQATAVKFCI